MKSFTTLITVLIVLTIFWILIILNLTCYFNNDNEKVLFFKNIKIQMKVVYALGILVIASYVYLLFSKKLNIYI